MTITMYDKFAFLPKRCDKCNRLFIWEWYNIHQTTTPDMRYTLEYPMCKQCHPREEKK